MDAQSGRIETLDALRGICAIAVALMHTEILTGVQIVPSAYLAVDLFFLMSGFVLGTAYDARLRKGGYAVTFFKRRLARLWPMWAIGMSIGAVLPLLVAHRTGYGGWLLAYTLGMLLLPLPTEVDLFPMNTPGWSLFFEAIANVVYAAIARHLDRRNLGLIVIAAAICLIGVAISNGSLLGGFDTVRSHVGLARVAFSFFAGLAIYKAPRPARFAGPLPFFLVTAVMTGLFFLHPSPPFRVVFDLAFVLIGCPLVMVVALKTTLPASWTAEALGALSYPLYAVHAAILLFALAVYGQLFGWKAMPMPVALALLGAVIIFSYWLGRTVEPFAQRVLGRVLRQRPVHVPLPPAG